MVWPASVITRNISFGKAVVLETGDDLELTVATKSTRSLISSTEGYLMESMMAVFVTGFAGDEVVFPLPVTNQPGWMDPETREILVVGPEVHSHLYLTTLTVRLAQQTIKQYTIGPYPLPQGTGTVDGETMLISDDTQEGVLVTIPEAWTEIIAAANAASNPAGSTAGQVFTSTGPGTAPIWADAEGGGGEQIRRANVSGVYPPRGTDELVPVRWIGPTQPVVALPTDPVNWLTTPTAMSGFDLFDRVVT